MAFKLTTPKNTRDIRAVKRTSSLATTAGALYTLPIAGGALVLAGATTIQRQPLYLANETTAASTSPFSGTIISKEDEFIADCDNNSSAGHNGQQMVLNASGLTINNTGSDVPNIAASGTGLFVQLDVVGAAADKKILVRKAI